MSTFNEILDSLKQNPSTLSLKIKGKVKKLKAFSLFTTKNFPDDIYYKGIFEDHSFMLLIPKEQEIYYSDELINKIESIKDEDIGTVEKINYNNKIYELGNKDDYEFTKELIFGTPFDIEGEVKFSDYFPIEGPKEFLSLGWLMRTGERADINCQIINSEEIEILK